ncbi:MAG: hypothetical protein H6714_04975 [Myxococcales bacterium]|nr:hypothetical protein [Myxococcales bacterium]
MKLVDLGSARGWWYVVLGALCLVVGIAVLDSRLLRPEYDLELVAPNEVAPGHPIPARTFLFRDPHRGVPELQPHSARLELLDLTGKRLAHAHLSPSSCADAEGLLWIGSKQPLGMLRLKATATAKDGTALYVSRALRVTSHPRGLKSEPRFAHPTQHRELGPVEVLAKEGKSSRFEVTVEQGSCLPERDCRLLVHTSLRPGVEVALDHLTGATAVTEGAVLVEGGYAALNLRVHGPVAHASIVATRGRTHLVRRALQLPVGLGLPYLFSESRAVPAAKEQLRLSVSLANCLILDAFEIAGGATYWRRSLAQSLPSIAKDADTASWAPNWPPLAPGRYRLQARTSPFNTGNSRSLIIFVVNKLLQSHDNFGAAPASSDLGLRFRAASQESAHILLPEASRSLPRERSRARARQRYLRGVVASMTVLAGVSLLLFFLVSGVRAQKKADQLGRARSGKIGSAPKNYRRWLKVLALAVLASALGTATFLLLWIYAR